MIKYSGMMLGVQENEELGMAVRRIKIRSAAEYK